MVSEQARQSSPRSNPLQGLAPACRPGAADSPSSQVFQRPHQSSMDQKPLWLGPSGSTLELPIWKVRRSQMTMVFSMYLKACPQQARNGHILRTKMLQVPPGPLEHRLVQDTEKMLETSSDAESGQDLGQQTTLPGEVSVCKVWGTGRRGPAGQSWQVGEGV